MQKLNNKTMLITGGSRGIGLATAKLFSKQGANTIITGRGADELDKAAKEIANCIAIQSDQGNVNDIKALFAQIDKQQKKLDGVFINAGIAERTELAEVDEQAFDQQMQINYKGAFFMAKESLPYLNSKAAIVFTSSVAAMLGIANLSIYSSTKAAVEGLTRTLATDLAAKGIRVNGISPGYIETSLSLKHNQNHYDEICQTIPLENRFGTAEEIAKVALFLLHDATYMTGVNLVVDGGFSIVK